jgi:lactose/L-arabinose transport system substrate-binding protein
MIYFLTAALLLLATSSCNIAAPSPPTKVTDAGDDVVLTVWAWAQDYNGKAVEIAAEYYSRYNPNVKVNIVTMSSGEIVSKMNTKFASCDYKGLPDIVLIEDYNIQSYLQLFPGEIRQLSPAINPGDFMDCKTIVSVYKGELYGVPFDSGVASLFYRTDFIEQAGFTGADMENITWDRFIEIGKTVKEKTGKLMLALDPNNLCQIRMMLQSAGQWYVKSDGKTINLANNQVLKDAIKTYIRIVNSGIALHVAGAGIENRAIINGDLATVLTGTWRIPVFMNATDEQAGKWAIAPIPRMAEVDDAVNASSLGGSGWYVIDKAGNADIAVDFLVKTFSSNLDLINELASKIYLVDTLKAAGSLPNYQIPNKVFSNQMILKDLFDWTIDVPPVNYGLYTNSIDNIIEYAVQLIMQGADIDEALQNAQIMAESLQVTSDSN